MGLTCPGCWGTVVRLPYPQRQGLERVATQANIQALARFNAQQVGADAQSQFYFDPHTKHYTGDQNVLEDVPVSLEEIQSEVSTMSEEQQDRLAA